MCVDYKHNKKEIHQWNSQTIKAKKKKKANYNRDRWKLLLLFFVKSKDRNILLTVKVQLQCSFHEEPTAHASLNHMDTSLLSQVDLLSRKIFRLIVLHECPCWFSYMLWGKVINELLFFFLSFFLANCVLTFNYLVVSIPPNLKN